MSGTRRRYVLAAAVAGLIGAVTGPAEAGPLIVTVTWTGTVTDSAGGGITPPPVGSRFGGVFTYDPETIEQDLDVVSPVGAPFPSHDPYAFYSSGGWWANAFVYPIYIDVGFSSPALAGRPLAEWNGSVPGVTGYFSYQESVAYRVSGTIDEVFVSSPLPEPATLIPGLTAAALGLAWAWRRKGKGAA